MSAMQNGRSIGQAIEHWLRRRKAARTLSSQLKDEPEYAQIENQASELRHGDDNETAKHKRAISLLWPPEAEHGAGSTCLRLSDQVSRDLGVSSLVHTLVPDTRVRKDVEQTLTNLITDIPTLEYRLDVLDDLIENPNVVHAFEQLVPLLELTFKRRAPVDSAKQGLFNVVWRLGELDNYLQALHIIDDALSDASLNSSALCSLRDDAGDQLKDNTYIQLEKELPSLLRQIRGARSLSIGVNLTSDLMPMSATIISVNSAPFADIPLLRTLFGKSAPGRIAKIHSFGIEDERGSQPIMTPLFRDLSDVMTQVSREISNALRDFTQITAQYLDALRGEVLFYLAAVRCIRTMRSAGLTMCRPAFRPNSDRLSVARDAYNINLAYEIERLHGPKKTSELVVASDVTFDDDGRILILTGPNSGGKTVYARTIGLMHVMAQTGMYVPAAEALLSPVDGIYTHFSIEEQISNQTGRLGDETKRLSEIIEHVSERGLVILNESLSSTSHSESIVIAEDFLQAMSMLGARVIYTTHLHDLAAHAEEMNGKIESKSKIRSIVALAEKVGSEDEHAEVNRLYKIVPGLPQGRSYALEIARQHGMSLQQIIATLKSRGVL